MVDQKPANLTGFLMKTTECEQTVDNFFTEKIFNDFNVQSKKSLKSSVFIDFLWITEQGCG
ncbi:MAG: hypothetical protein EB003_12085 [Flavobacteriia bacterium]|nr:hypothetical protein [Flavobacteriia bacterium]